MSSQYQRFRLTRTITAIGLIQLVLIVVGFVGLAIELKIRGWTAQETRFEGFSLPVFLRLHSPKFLIVLLLWTLMASCSEARAKTEVMKTLWIWAGVALIGVIVSAFLAAVATAEDLPVHFLPAT